MPEISRFLGIIIALFYKDHSPPHFHAKYGEYEITVDIIGIGEGLATFALPHHRTYGSVYGDS
jgi:hypothetical protein